MSLPIEEPSVTPEKGHQVKLSQGRERDEREVRWGRKASPKDEMHGDRVKARKEFSHYLWQKSHSDKRDFLVISPKGLWVIKLQCLVCHWWPKERLCWQITVKKLEAGTDIGGRKIWQISTRHRPRPAETSEPDVRVPDGARRLACFCSKSWKFNIARANKNSDAAKTWWAPLLPDVLATASETSTLVHLLSCCSFRMILQCWQCPETRIGLTEEAIFFSSAGVPYSILSN